MILNSPTDLLEYHEDTLDRHLLLLMDAATGILHDQTQDSLVKLISAMQPDYECASKLPGLEEALGEEDSAVWICVNAFYARLTAANLLRYEWAAALRCKDLIEALKESREPQLISTLLCAAAQHVIYITPNVDSYCKMRAELGHALEWEEWKKGFQSAREIPGLSKDAHWYSHLAMATMERMEETDLPKSSRSFVELVDEFQERSAAKSSSNSKAWIHPRTEFGIDKSPRRPRSVA